MHQPITFTNDHIRYEQTKKVSNIIIKDYGTKQYRSIPGVQNCTSKEPILGTPLVPCQHQEPDCTDTVIVTY